MKRPEDRKIYWIDPRLPVADYNAQWMAGIRARCIETPEGCWIWTRFCHPFRNMKPGQRGYGNAAYRGKNVRTHRKMLEIKLGQELPKGLQACHTCDTPPCCNPEHLYAATNQQNHLDGGARGRMNGQWKTHCKHGHEFTPENTYMSPRPNGRPVRNCKECDRVRRESEPYKVAARERQRRNRAKRLQLKTEGSRS